MKCPCKGCDYESRDRKAVFGHLYTKHLKSEIIEALLAKKEKRVK